MSVLDTVRGQWNLAFACHARHGLWTVSRLYMLSVNLAPGLCTLLQGALSPCAVVLDTAHVLPELQELLTEHNDEMNSMCCICFLHNMQREKARWSLAWPCTSTSSRVLRRQVCEHNRLSNHTS